MCWSQAGRVRLGPPFSQLLKNLNNCLTFTYYYGIVIVVEIVRHGLSDVKGAVVKIPVGIKNDGYGNNVNRDLSIAWVYDVVMV